MFPIAAQTKVFLSMTPTDMRKSFRGLLALIEGVLRQEPATGHLFVFVGRRRDLIKLIYWDGTGFCIWYKRLEVGRFQLPALADVDASRGIELSSSQLSLILDGIDLGSVKQRLRYRRSTPGLESSSQASQSAAKT